MLYNVDHALRQMLFRQPVLHRAWEQVGRITIIGWNLLDIRGGDPGCRSGIIQCAIIQAGPPGRDGLHCKLPVPARDAKAEYPIMSLQGRDITRLPSSDESLLFSLRQLGVSYRARPVLRGIDWTWRRGEHWAVLGQNGAGKTTLARVLSGEQAHYCGAYERSARLDAGGIAYVGGRGGRYRHHH